MSALVIDNVGLLVTNDSALGEGPLGIVRDAAIVFEGLRRRARRRLCRADGGAPYAAGGIRVTTAATRAASCEELLMLARARRREAPEPASPSWRSSLATGSTC